MTKNEFIERLEQVGQSEKGVEERSIPTDKEYRVIEKVYTFYPTISELNGKYQVAWLYRMFGMSIFYDMLERCDIAMEKDREIRHLKHELMRASEEMDLLRNGPLEKDHDKPNLLERKDGYDECSNLAETQD